MCVYVYFSCARTLRFVCVDMKGETKKKQKKNDYQQNPNTFQYF